MTKPQNSGRVIGITFKKSALPYTKETFPMYAIWIRDFFMIHCTIYEYIGDSLEIFHNILHDKFFEWLNQSKNYSKFMFEIKRIFMAMADDVLIREIMVKKLKNPVLIDLSDLEEIYISESEYDYDIDYFSDPDPCYNLIEEIHVSQVNISESDISNYDDKYYSSFFS
jgi:hypothetical protein